MCKKKLLGLSLFSFLAALGANAQMMPPQGPAVRMPMGGMRNHEPGYQRMYRHAWVMMKGIPQQYLSLQNPLPPENEVAARGKTLYTEHCTACHGPEGLGDGEAGTALNPPPGNLTYTMNMPISSAPFLFWTLTEGGTKLGTDMPVFGDVLSEEERWSVIHYLRADFGPQPETE